MTGQSSVSDGCELIWVSERHLLACFAGRSSPESWARVRTAHAALCDAGLDGLVDAIPAYTTILLEFDLARLDAARAERSAADAIRTSATGPLKPGRLIEVPACYAPEFAPDIEAVATCHGLTTQQVATTHASVEYHAAFIGFQPGFAYLGGVPASIATPRLESPRTRVLPGSIGIAGDQTGIYPFASPGGWRLIGRTPLRMFDAARDRPCLIEMGDRVKFVPISAMEFVNGERSGAAESTRGGFLAMGAAFRVIEAGLLATIQDLGRPGRGLQGIPRGGAADSESLRRANALVGNDAAAAALELTLTGVCLEVMADTCIAVCGGEADVQVNGAAAAWNTAVRVHRGDVLRIGSLRRGCRAYVAVAGGIEAPMVMGSASTNLVAGFGGLDGRALRRGDVLHTSALRATARVAESRGEEPRVGALRVTLRPDFDRRMQATFLGSKFRVSTHSDRVGVRLEGAELSSFGDGRMPSEGMMHGAIQVPPSGRPMILGCEHPTTGGYPVLGCVIAADLDRIGQLRPGESVSFEPVTLERARELACAS